VYYVDTAHVYHGGRSKAVLAQALKDGYREKVRIADKLPVWETKKPDDVDRLFAMELERLEVPRIDFCLLYCLSGGPWASARDLGVLDWLEMIKADGEVPAGRQGERVDAGDPRDARGEEVGTRRFEARCAR
jgi:hypothetical protein